MKRMSRSLAVLLAAAAITAASAVSAAAEEKIQLAVLLDTSSSMDGLINQARAQLWKVVNTLARATRAGKHPVLEVALFEYGNDGLPEKEGYIRMVTGLTTDLDLVSERLFALSTNGGSEYCGMVIDKAVGTLGWSASADVLKVIYIAGNEPFDQGSVAWRASAAKAVKKGIIVNTIYCGPNAEGAGSGWRDGAILAEGRYASIDQDAAAVEIVTPWDQEIVKLGDQLNGTYLAYGAVGGAMKERQAEQDSNATAMGAPASVERSVAKSQAAYANESWDLLDALKSGTVKLSSLKDEQLPEEMRRMNATQRQAYVDDLAKRRASLQAAIQAADAKRRDYVAAQAKAQAGASTLDQAMISAVREQASKKGFAL